MRRKYKRYNYKSNNKNVIIVKQLKETIIHVADYSNMYTDWKIMAWQAVQQERIPRGKPHANLHEGNNTIMTGKGTG
jgi:hypothetical protein